MLTISKFVGAFLQGLAMSRTMSDGMSSKIADRYLEHDYLRGFPIPRMTLKQVDLEVNFSVAPATQLEILLKEPEISKNIAYQFRERLNELPKSEEFKEYFGTSGSPGSEWEHGIEELVVTIQRLLSEKVIDKETLVHTLSLAVENFFYAVNHKRPGKGILAGLRALFVRQQDAKPEPASNAVRDWAKQQVTDILDSALPGGIATIDETPDVTILIGAAELEGQDPARFQKAKLSFASEDRKWVVSEKNGEKSYILDRH